ncbi:uncharacterized protein [Anas platyrhynchos]|uniref:uncharacterized protein n=1 Tax=Anas platyrhynchos TaxID=8839 RepID=UPI003AF1EC46
MRAGGGLQAVFWLPGVLGALELWLPGVLGALEVHVRAVVHVELAGRTRFQEAQLLEVLLAAYLPHDGDEPLHNAHRVALQQGPQLPHQGVLIQPTAAQPSDDGGLQHVLVPPGSIEELPGLLAHPGAQRPQDFEVFPEEGCPFLGREASDGRLGHGLCSPLLVLGAVVLRLCIGGHLHLQEVVFRPDGVADGGDALPAEGAGAASLDPAHDAPEAELVQAGEDVAGLLGGPLAHRAGDVLGLTAHGVGSLQRAGESCRWGAASPGWHRCHSCCALQEGERPGSVAEPGQAAAVPRPLSRTKPQAQPRGTCRLTAHLHCCEHSLHSPGCLSQAGPGKRRHWLRGRAPRAAANGPTAQLQQISQEILARHSKPRTNAQPESRHEPGWARL